MNDNNTVRTPFCIDCFHFWWMNGSKRKSKSLTLTLCQWHKLELYEPWTYSLRTRCLVSMYTKFYLLVKTKVEGPSKVSKSDVFKSGFEEYLTKIKWALDVYWSTVNYGSKISPGYKKCEFTGLALHTLVRYWDFLQSHQLWHSLFFQNGGFFLQSYIF